MIVILKQNAEQNEVNALLKQLEDMGFDHHYSKGENSAIVGIIGDIEEETAARHLMVIAVDAIEITVEQ